MSTAGAGTARRGRRTGVRRRRTARRASIVGIAAALLVSGTGVAAPPAASDLHPLSLGTAGALAAISSDISLMAVNCAVAAAPGVQISAVAGQCNGGPLVYTLAASIGNHAAPALLWSLMGDGERITMRAGGSLSPLPGTIVGGLGAYTLGPEEGFCFDVGLRFEGEPLSIAASLRHLGSAWIGLEDPLTLHLAAGLRAAERVRLFIGLLVVGDGQELAVGAQMRLLGVGVRWGIAFDGDASISRVGLGMDLDTIDVPFAAAIGVLGTPLAPCASIRAAIHTPPWW
jgi:hypothetical protein